MNKKIILLTILLLSLNIVFATTINDITAPITKIYDLLKAVISIIGIIALTIAGAVYMFSGTNIQNRENAKNMVSYALVGLVLVWVAPFMVLYLTAPI
ncbi:MAG: pilin [Candidatus ainarchaeum sp.]|nr:pilin [Candidatus ainarchaeum sp.]